MAVKGSESPMVSRWVTTYTSVNAYLNEAHNGTTATCNQVRECKPVGEWQVSMPDYDHDAKERVAFLHVDYKKGYDSEENYFNSIIHDEHLTDYIKDMLIQ